jgi:S-adenosylmethionine:tRNA ribosyltransferase-isomerase
MKPATEPRQRHERRLVHVDVAAGTFRHTHFAELPTLLNSGDLLVVNDAATLPASFRLQNFDAELRLVGHTDDPQTFRAILFGAGDYHTDTDLRPAPPVLTVGAQLEFGPDLHARVQSVDPSSPRLLTLRFASSGAALWSALYRHGRPIQYRHVERPLELWDVQNTFAGKPFAFELPSAGLPLDHAVLLALKRRGIRIAALTHAAGISATGSAALDARLPLPERYEISEDTASIVKSTLALNGRVVAVGTTVVRALEASALQHGAVLAGPGEARLRITAGFRPRVVSALVSGMHERGSSHFDLLEAFASRSLLERVERDCEQRGYLTHEFGDSCLVVGPPVAGASLAAPTRVGIALGAL